MWWDELGSVEGEHPGLVSGTHALIVGLQAAPDRFGFAMLDYQYTDRLVQVANHLQAVGVLAAAGQYASGFTVLRTALEHALTDSLLLNAVKRRDRYGKATPEWEGDQRKAWENGESGTEDIVAIERVGKDVIVTRGAYPLKDPSGEVVGLVPDSTAVSATHLRPPVSRALTCGSRRAVRRHGIATARSCNGRPTHVRCRGA